MFADILHLARGYPLAIRDREHRAQIVRDCRYFNLRGLEQKVVACDVGWNPVRRRGEITIGVEDVVLRGVAVADANSDAAATAAGAAYVTYARPFTKDDRNDLIVQAEECVMDRQGGIEFLGSTKEAMAKLFKAVGPGLEVGVVITGETDVVVNGEGQAFPSLVPDNPRKRPRLEAEAEADSSPDTSPDAGTKWFVETGQWLLRISQKIELVAVKLDVYTSTRERTRKRVFLA